MRCPSARPRRRAFQRDRAASWSWEVRANTAYPALKVCGHLLRVCPLGPPPVTALCVRRHCLRSACKSLLSASCRPLKFANCSVDMCARRQTDTRAMQGVSDSTLDGSARWELLFDLGQAAIGAIATQYSRNCYCFSTIVVTRAFRSSQCPSTHRPVPRVVAYTNYTNMGTRPNGFVLIEPRRRAKQMLLPLARMC
jgi:hypothetical protein